MGDRNSIIHGNQIKDRTLTQLELDFTTPPTDGQIIKINMPTGDFTPIELSTDGTLSGDSDDVIPTEKAVKTYADTKEPSLGFTAEDVANKDTDITLSANSDVKYPSQKAIKAYVDSAVQGLDWQESVLDRIDFTTVEPGSPSVGDRYINTVTGTSSSTAQSVTINYIYEWNGSTWTEIIPNEGFACWVEDEDSLYVFNGSVWSQFGSTSTHNNLSGLQGGISAEYYHLTSAEYTELSNWLDNVILGAGGDLTLANGTNINEFSIDGTLSGNSDNAVPTEKAVKTYVDANSGATQVWGVSGNVPSGTTYYFALGGGAGTVIADYETKLNIGGTFSKLYLHATPTGNQLIATVYKNGVATALTVTLANPDANGSDLTHSFTAVQGDRISIYVRSWRASANNIVASMLFTMS